MYSIKFLTLYLGASLGLLFSTSCQKDIPLSERFVQDTEQVLTEEEGATLLVEKFTGQLCVNCPGASKFLAGQAKAYPNRLITVAMHAASHQLVEPMLGASEADTYAHRFVSGSFALPGVVLSRQKAFSGRYYSPVRGLWAEAIMKHLRKPRQYRIALSAGYAEGNVLEVQTTVAPMQGAQRDNLMLQLWLVEDVIGTQVGPGGGAEYLHHNVLRKALNGIWGAPLELETVAVASYPLPAVVVDAKATKVVAFVYDKTSGEVYEATESRVEMK